MSNGLHTLAVVCTVLPISLMPESVFAQMTASTAVVPSPEPTVSERIQRFEIGAHAAIAPGMVVADYLFAGVSASYALRPWLAVGAEIDIFTVAALGNEPGRWRAECPSCTWSGVQTLALGELRMPLGHDAVWLFGRLAMGPAFVTRADTASSVVAAARGSVGVELRLWHVYARPFAIVGAIGANAPRLGFGFETGAAF
jgi:hypothetical protein